MSVILVSWLCVLRYLPRTNFDVRSELDIMVAIGQLMVSRRKVNPKSTIFQSSYSQQALGLMKLQDHSGKIARFQP